MFNLPPESQYPWVTTTYIDVAQVRRDALAEVIVYLEGQIQKLVATMHSPTNDDDIHAMADCWDLTCYINAIKKMKETT